MRYKIAKLLGLTAISLMIESAWALQVQEKTPTLGDLAQKFIVGTELLTRLVLVFCVSIGIILVISAILAFRAHIQNPKFSPLDRPFFLLLFGLVLIALPYFGDIFAPTGSVLELKKEEAKTKMVAPIDIDAPLELGNEYDH